MLENRLLNVEVDEVDMLKLNKTRQTTPILQGGQLLDVHSSHGCTRAAIYTG